MPKRNGRPRPVARMAGDVVVVNTWRRRMVVGNTGRRRLMARLRTGIPMPCYGRRIRMTGGSSMLSRAWLSRAWLGCAWLGCRSRDLRRPRLLGRSCRSSVAAMVTALRRSDCRCAECRAGDPDDCEFHEVVVHGIPSLSVCGLVGELVSPLHQARRTWHPFLTIAFERECHRAIQPWTRQSRTCAIICPSTQNRRRR